MDMLLCHIPKLVNAIRAEAMGKSVPCTSLVAVAAVLQAIWMTCGSTLQVSDMCARMRMILLQLPLPTDLLVLGNQMAPWSQKTPVAAVLADGMPSARRYHAAVVLHDRLWVFGGVQTQKAATFAPEMTAGMNHPQYLDDFWFYDFKSETGRNKWYKIKALGSLPPPRSDHSLVVIRTGFHSRGLQGQRILLFGGRGATTHNDLWEFVPNMRTWTQGEWMELNTFGGSQIQRHGFRAVTAGGVMLVMNGKVSKQVASNHTACIFS
jgi:hypothetical protein